MADDVAPIIDVEPVPDPIRSDSVQSERRSRQRNRTNRALGSKSILVNITDNIQHAIDDVKKNGGGVVSLKTGTYTNVDYNIVIPDNVKLEGEGRQNTIIDFNGNVNSVQIIGSSSDIRNSAGIRGLAVINSADAAGIDIDWADDVVLEDTLVSSCTNKSYRLRRSRFVTFRDAISDTPGTDGFDISTTSERSVISISFYSCIAQLHGGVGFKFTNSATQVVGNIYGFACRSNNGTGDGFDFEGGVQMDGSFIACISASNGVKGFDINVQNLSFIGCIAESNTDDGFEVSDLENKIIGCKSEGNGTEWDLQVRTTFVGNSLDFGSSIDPTGEFSTASKDSISDMIGNMGVSPVHDTRITRMQNVHGSTVGGGKTITWRQASDQAGSQFEAIFVRGSSLVAGVLLEGLDDDEWGAVQTRGFTKILQVNGTDDIAVGDELSLYSANAVAGKAREGDTVFAIALEAYTTDDSSGVIDALLIEPRRKSGLNTQSRAYRNGTQAITTGTATKVELNAESYDTGGDFDSATNFRFIAPADGYYQVNAALELKALADTKIGRIFLYKNGAEFARSQQFGNGSDDTSPCITDIVQLDATDYVEMFTTHNHGSDRNVGGGTTRTFMSIQRLV